MRNGFAGGDARPGPSLLHRSQLGQLVDHGPVVSRVGNQSERVGAASGTDDAHPTDTFVRADSGVYPLSAIRASIMASLERDWSDNSR